MGSTSHQLRLKDLVFWGQHGHTPAERELGNRFEVDVEIEAELSEACSEDRLEATVNLTTVYEIVRKHAEGDPCILIETLAEQIASEIAALRQVETATVRVRKVQPPIKGMVQGVMEAEVTRVS
jgi:dihydroneopterin aldolase